MLMASREKNRQKQLDIGKYGVSANSLQNVAILIAKVAHIGNKGKGHYYRSTNNNKWSKKYNK